MKLDMYFEKECKKQNKNEEGRGYSFRERRKLKWREKYEGEIKKEEAI